MDFTKIDISKYRVKTEKEFEREFGEDWRWEIFLTFPETMDHLLGCNLFNLEIVDQHVTMIEIKDKDGELWFLDRELTTKII